MCEILTRYIAPEESLLALASFGANFLQRFKTSSFIFIINKIKKINCMNTYLLKEATKLAMMTTSTIDPKFGDTDTLTELIIEFYEDRFSYMGKYYSDLSGMDKYTFKNHPIAIGNIEESEKKVILKYFLMLNRTGKVMDQKHLDKVEQMYQELCTE